MHQVAGAILIAAAFVVNAIHYSALHLQRAIIDTKYSGDEAIDKHMSMDIEHRYFIGSLLCLGLLLMLVGIVSSFRNRMQAAKH